MNHMLPPISGRVPPSPPPGAAGDDNRSGAPAHWEPGPPAFEMEPPAALHTSDGGTGAPTMAWAWHAPRCAATGDGARDPLAVAATALQAATEAAANAAALAVVAAGVTCCGDPDIGLVATDNEPLFCMAGVATAGGDAAPPRRPTWELIHCPRVGDDETLKLLLSPTQTGEPTGLWDCCGVWMMVTDEAACAATFGGGGSAIPNEDRKPTQGKLRPPRNVERVMPNGVPTLALNDCGSTS